MIIFVVTLQQSFKKNGSTMLFFFFLAYNLGILFSVSVAAIIIILRCLVLLSSSFHLYF